MTFLISAAALSMICGAAFTIGAMAACRLAKWSPVNLTVTVHNPPGVRSEVSLHPDAPEPAP
jgi:hypothetical protein